MSKPRYRWWGYVRHVVRDYQKLIASSNLTADDMRDRDAVTWAIDQTMQRANGREHLSLINGVYWGSTEQRISPIIRMFSWHDYTSFALGLYIITLIFQVLQVKKK